MIPLSASDKEFFHTMPAYASTYAIPIEYAQEGLVKYGRNAAVHAWALKKLADLTGSVPAKVITVFLDDKTDVVALKDGVPLMSSHGFSDTDGIMSRTGCGAIDTSIVFQLFSAGYSAEDIHDVLSMQSGFNALLGDNAGFHDLILRQGPQAEEARAIFSYQLVKMVGACVAALEGIDAIVFMGDDTEASRDWACDFLGEMDCLGVKKSERPLRNEQVLTADNSITDSYYFEYNKDVSMAGLLSAQTTNVH
ncbi:MAG: hypothetical protein HQL17_07790 [Candidatus Omnitrophica bacterium]|nr:hypothetical protein [Candidatus Omnitrophota bacterium]